MRVCFTGHRDIGTEEETLRLRACLAKEVQRLVAEGADVFLAGGALGFDTEAALAVLHQKRLTPEIRLELVLPCRDQYARWSPAQIELYERILAQADSHVFISERYFRGVMHKRNRALVDGADVCVAYLRTGAGGGTAYTVDYATRRGVPVINLFDRL